MEPPKLRIQVQFWGGWGKAIMSGTQDEHVAKGWLWPQRYLSRVSSPNTVAIAIVCLYLTGYSRNFNGLKGFLSSQPTIANKIELIPRKDTTTTGNFEVTVVGTGKVLHSKRHAGQGKADSNSERMAILEQIQEILEDE